jgi:hypothetical protein
VPFCSNPNNEYLWCLFQFEKVYAINLPERSDKRDSMLLQAELTNFTLEMVDGVLGSEVSKKALPHVGFPAYLQSQLHN